VTAKGPDVSEPDDGEGKDDRAGSNMGRTFRAMSNPNYRLYWTGQIISVSGTWMQNTAMAWLVLQLTNSALALGSVSTVQFAPILLFSLFGGVFADRFPKRRLLVVTQSIMLLQALALAVLVATGLIRLWEIYLLAAVQGCANALDNPVRQAFLVEMVGTEDLPNAIALNSSQFQVGRLVGPALGGLSIPLVGISGCFFLNSASYIAAVGTLALMQSSRFFPSRRSIKATNVLGQMAEGLRYAVSSPDIALALILMVFLGTFGFNMSVLLPLIARYVLHSGPSGFGLVTSALAVGSLIAALSIAYMSRASRLMLLGGAAFFSFFLLAVSFSHWWAVTLPLMVMVGLASTIYQATNNARLQLVSPSHLRGRIMSLNSLLFAGTTPIGALVIGALADYNGVQAATAELGIICMAGVVVALIYFQRVRHRLIPESELFAGADARAHSAIADAVPVPAPDATALETAGTSEVQAPAGR
jgi:MFS family permease